MRATISRHAHFNAAHRLHNPRWDDQKNARVFGVCNNPHYHGHNYELIVSLTGPIDPDTGYVFDAKELADLIKKHIEVPLDHRNINEEVEPFCSGQIASAENIAVWIYDRLVPQFPSTVQCKITLYETPRNYVEYSGQ